MFRQLILPRMYCGDNITGVICVDTHRNWLLRLKEFSSEKRFVRNPSVFQYLTIMFFGNCRQNSNALFDVKTKISKI